MTTGRARPNLECPDCGERYYSASPLHMNHGLCVCGANVQLAEHLIQEMVKREFGGLKVALPPRGETDHIA